MMTEEQMIARLLGGKPPAPTPKPAQVKADECWHFYTGDPLLIYVIQTNGRLDIIQLGNDLDHGHLFQYVVLSNCWFAGRPAP